MVVITNFSPGTLMKNPNPAAPGVKIVKYFK